MCATSSPASRPNDSVERFTGLGVKVIRGAARFTDAATVAVGETRIRARRFVVATGSRPAVPPIANLDAVPYLTNETVFDLSRLPAHLIIIGAGPIGLEMAQAFRRLGSEVTVLEAATPLPKDDPELVRLLLEDLRGEGIAIREGATVTRVAKRGRNGVRVTLEGAAFGQVDGTHLLLAAGRRPARRRPRPRRGGHRLRRARHRGRRAAADRPTAASTRSATSCTGRNSRTGQATRRGSWSAPSSSASAAR